MPNEPRQPGPTSPAPQAAEPLDETELAARYWDRIRLLALRRLRDSAAAEDVAQETIRLVGEALRAGRVENLDSLPGYAFRTAQHLCLQRFRSTSRETKALERLQTEPGADRPAADPLVALIGEERRVSVRRAVGQLAANDRELLRCLYFDDLDSAAVAARLGITAEALRVRKHRALRRLAVVLGDASEDVTR
ncbi:MAG: RNA polymerase sigma factor [Gemmatimonadales bacterium]